ncbi:gamma-glutamylcyclotransferase [Bacillus sp. CGMCC 1.16607]|uniref:gamma-glutamylcyclotransferase n=1 Tax=Bacillus sp. CGMCC 1.16607 TaxID=3351842 RepID=UPI00363F4705
MVKQFVFVYGTLRKHERNHFLLKGAIRISEQAWTNGELFDTGRGYPMMRPSEDQKVYGELYEINGDQLEKLDELEDYQVGRTNNLYDRVVQMIRTDIGDFEAFVYLSEAENEIRIPNGDWKVYQLTVQKPETVYYYAYGSCMDMDRFQKAKVDQYFEKVVGAATLENYSMKYLFTSADGGRADIIEDGGLTEGILYETPYDAVEYLFHREGYHTGWYRATFVDVLVDGRVYQDALTFHVYDKKEEIAPPEHYAVEILRGSKNRVSAGYYKKLVKQLKDLNTPFDLSDWE